MHTGASLIDVPQLRVAPADVVRQCREIVPNAELVYMGDGQWLLGTVERTDLRERVGRYKLARAATARWAPGDARAFARWRWIAWEGLLLTQGFASIQTFAGDPDSAVSEYLRVREYQWARELDDALRRVAYDNDDDTLALDDGADPAISPITDEYRLRHAWRAVRRQQLAA